MFLIIVCNSVFASFYSYEQQITITDSDGSYMGYVLPYQKEILFEDYAYLKWKRQGFLEGNSFPIALIKGTTTALPFGIEGELLRVKINSISSSGVDLTIDKSDVVTEIQNIPETLPENIEAISNEAENEINLAIEDLSKRVDKFANRGYYSSLHILSYNPNNAEKRGDSLIKNKESEFAEKIADKVIPLLISTFVAGTYPITGTIYTNIVNQIPSSVRHEITQFIYNIDTDSETKYSTDYLLSKSGVTTILIGNPNRNKFSSNLNNELKRSGLPYFEDGKIIGKRTYSEDSIGLIAAIPEEKVWLANTLQNRWDNDKIRLYKTMISGIGDDGLEAAAVWYNDQLDNARILITSVASLTDGADSSDILRVVSDNFNKNPKSTIGSATLLHGWILTGLSSLQSTQIDRVDSLGYVVIVKKNGNLYDVLEVHTINGYKTNYFLNPYEAVQEFEEAIEPISEVVEEASETKEDNNPVIQNLAEEPLIEEEATEENQEITGMVVEEAESGEAPEPKRKWSSITIINWIINLFRGWFG